MRRFSSRLCRSTNAIGSSICLFERHRQVGQLAIARPYREHPTTSQTPLDRCSRRSDGVRLYDREIPRRGVVRPVRATCAVTCGQSVRFTAGSEGMALERRAAIAEHRWPITTPARSSSWVAVDGIVPNRATRWSCTTRLGSLIRGPNRPSEEVTLAVLRHTSPQG